MKLEKEELADEALNLVRELIRSAQLQLTAEVELNAGEEDGIQMKLSGPDEDMVLADNARLLYAINHLINQIFYRRSREGFNFFLDCSNYREERALELELLAQKAAEKVMVSGSKVSLQPMPASERRIIHLSLAEEPGVRTQSEGSGRYRRVLISPGD
jgi:spoIIIJ-associated protein